MRWSAGEAEVERLLDQGSIERVQGAQADGESWLERARRGLDAARIVAEAAPDSSIILAYGASLRAFGGLRRRRNELEYPLYPTERASADEAAEALTTAGEIIDAVTRLLPNLGFF